MADQRRAGTISLKVDGVICDAKGNFTYGLGNAKREAIIGADGLHGYKETPQVPFIEGAITDRGDLNVADLVNGKDLTVTLDLANGKTIVLRDAWFAGDGNPSTEEAEIPVRWEGATGKET